MKYTEQQQKRHQDLLGKVLGYVSAADGPQLVRDIAGHLTLSTSHTHKLLHELQLAGLVERVDWAEASGFQRRWHADPISPEKAERLLAQVAQIREQQAKARELTDELERSLLARSMRVEDGVKLAGLLAKEGLGRRP